MKYFTRCLLLAILVCFSTNVSSQSFTIVDSLPEGAYGAAAWGDYDNDGFYDLVYIVQATPDDICNVYHNIGNAFTPVAQHFPHLFNPSVKWADLNNDGFDDLVMNGADSNLVNRTFIYQSIGNGTFTSMANTIPGLTAGTLAIADYNNDGLKDIAITGMDSMGAHRAYIYKCTGPFTYANIHAQVFGTHFGEMQWGDYNNDSLPDLVVNGIGDNNDFRTRVYRNMGADSFLLQPIFMFGTGGTVDWLDYDNDGWLDILVTGYDSTSVNNITELHHNNGNGTFTTVTSNLPLFGEPSGVAVADFNMDSIADICFIGGAAIFPSNYSAMAFGSGTATFNLQPFIAGGILNAVAEAADIDSDGDYDLLFNYRILRNDGPVGLAGLFPGNNDVKVFPNPSQHQVHVKATIPVLNVNMYDVNGSLVRSGSGFSNELDMDLSGLGSGNYFLDVRMAGGQQVFRKVTLQK